MATKEMLVAILSEFEGRRCLSATDSGLCRFGRFPAGSRGLRIGLFGGRFGPNGTRYAEPSLVGQFEVRAMTQAMGYYLRIGQDGLPLEVWKIDSNVAIRVGVANAEEGPGSYFKAKPGETIWATIRQRTPWMEPDGQNPFHRVNLRPGEYYPRIARPSDQHPKEAPGLSPGVLLEINTVAVARKAAGSLHEVSSRCYTAIRRADGRLKDAGIKQRFERPVRSSRTLSR